MYMRAIYLGTGNDGLQTGVGAEFETPEETMAAFDSIKQRSIPISDAPFLIDLWDEEQGIIESIGVSEELYTEVTGQPVHSRAVYSQIDSDYWTQH